MDPSFLFSKDLFLLFFSWKTCCTHIFHWVWWIWWKCTMHARFFCFCFYIFQFKVDYFHLISYQRFDFVAMGEISRKKCYNMDDKDNATTLPHTRTHLCFTFLWCRFENNVYPLTFFSRHVLFLASKSVKHWIYPHKKNYPKCTACSVN